jgi:hypothetical protein
MPELVTPATPLLVSSAARLLFRRWSPSPNSPAHLPLLCVTRCSGAPTRATQRTVDGFPTVALTLVDRRVTLADEPADTTA